MNHTSFILPIILSVLAAFGVVSGAETPIPGLPPKLIRDLETLRDASLKSTRGMERLAFMCDTFGPRLSGSTNLEAAIDWILGELKRDGFDRAEGEPVAVPRWIRGEESLRMIGPRAARLPMLGLGGSVATPAEGIVAEALVVTNYADLQARGTEARGKIVVFDVPFTTYGETVAFRVGGAVEAAKVGAAASLVRSVGPFSLRTPHTGMMSYADGVPRIPHAAISSEDAAWMLREQRRGHPLKLELKMSAKSETGARSRNVVADYRGWEHPEQVVVMGGHIDSWDVGQGAQDDGGGCIASWEVIRQAKALGLRPRRTMRLVLWTNEENGLAGARAYAAGHKAELANHVLAFESDEGIFAPTGFRFTGSERAMGLLKSLLPLMLPANARSVVPGAGAADASQLLPAGVPILDLKGDRERYFWFHHTEADTVDKVRLEDLQSCTAAMSVLLYGVADLPERLPR